VELIPLECELESCAMSMAKFNPSNGSQIQKQKGSRFTALQGVRPIAAEYRIPHLAPRMPETGLSALRLSTAAPTAEMLFQAFSAGRTRRTETFGQGQS
jgi:hypothetical protein